MAAHLLVETADPGDFEYIIEEKKRGEPQTMYIKGPYMCCGEVNKNKRIYDPEEMAGEVARYTEEMINTKRALGELNHPTSAEVDLERACHMVVDLAPANDNVYMGKSKVLSTPSGLIVQSLIRDGCSLGMSTRSLGKLAEEQTGINKVSDMRLVAVDCVADPSYPEAFVNGILESKQYVLNKYGQYIEAYDDFEAGIDSLPKKDIEMHLKEHILSFLEKIKEKV